MSVLVLTYPEIETKDYDWIQNIRSKHHERYFHIVEPHFTIIFPVFDIPTDVFIKHVELVSKKFNTFYFVLRCAQIVKDSFSDYTDVFLIPEEGHRIFVKLHDSFYTGPIEKDLRLDIPFIPHLGIASDLDAIKCKNIADDINASTPEIVGEINKLDVVSFENDKVTTIKEIMLNKLNI